MLLIVDARKLNTMDMQQRCNDSNDSLSSSSSSSDANEIIANAVK